MLFDPPACEELANPTLLLQILRSVRTLRMGLLASLRTEQERYERGSWPYY